MHNQSQQAAPESSQPSTNQPLPSDASPGPSQDIEMKDAGAKVEHKTEDKKEEVLDAKKKEALDVLEKEVLAKCQYLNGQTPTQADKEFHETIQSRGLRKHITTEPYPFLFAWLTLVDQFQLNQRIAWPEEAPQQQQEKAPAPLTRDRISEILENIKAETDKEGDERRERQKWENYVPKNEKRPADEFFDLQQIYHNCIGGEPEDISDEKNGGMLKYLMKSSDSLNNRTVEEQDIVYYTCETRFDNGQLVDFNQKRKARLKFDMADQRYHEHQRKAFLTMRKGDQAWIKYSPDYHKNIYHSFCKKDQIHKDKSIGQFIFMKLHIDSVRRQPVYKDKVTYQGKLEYFEKVREIGKELIQDQEYANAKELYSRCLGEFKNMPRNIRDSLDEDQKKQRNDIMLILNLNLSFCQLKRNAATDAIKFAKEAIKLDPQSSKGHYRLSMAYKLNKDLDPAKEHLKIALQLEPKNKGIREEYEQLCDLKSKKEQEWYSAMSGFYTSDKLKRIEKKEQTETILREKVKRKHFGDDANPGSNPEFGSSEMSSNQQDQDMQDDDENGGGYEIKKAEIKIRSR